MTQLQNQFEGQSNGVTVSDANSVTSGAAFTNTAGIGAYNTADASVGTTCIVGSITTTGTGLFDIDDAAASASYSASFDLKLTANVSVVNTQFGLSIRSLAAN